MKARVHAIKMIIIPKDIIPLENHKVSYNRKPVQGDDVQEANLNFRSLNIFPEIIILIPMTRDIFLSGDAYIISRLVLPITKIRR